MKAYLILTGTLFGLMAVVHVWRAIAEWPSTPGAGFFGLMAALILLPAVLSIWAWRLLLKRCDKNSQG
jgi:ABC-type uncharacterized transport system permease subunit